MQVNLENNKYSLIFDETEGTLVVNRNGEYWMGYTGNKLVYSLMARIIELESELDRALIEETEDEDNSCLICGEDRGTTCGAVNCAY